MLSQDFLQKIEERLKKQKDETLRHIDQLSSDDPFNINVQSTITTDRTSPDDEAQINEMHDRITSQVESLEKQNARINYTLERIGNGSYGVCSYGVCEVCGKDIGESRLLIMPLASMCLDDEKKMEKNVKSKVQ
jgi:DnaK suppressor protein